MRTPLVLAAALALTTSSLSQAAAPPQPRLQVLSSRADLVSGGDALVEVTGVPRGTRAVLAVDGADRSRALAWRPNGRLQGLVSGLRVGRSELVVRTPGGTSRLTFTHAPKGGPLFAGPQVQPWVCGTEAAGLGAPRDKQCNARTVVTYQYKSADGSFQPYDPAHPPTDVQAVTTDTGRTVPFVVRTERGTVDRGIYELSVLADPKAALQPWTPYRGWNGKLLWTFGGGTKGSHKQGLPATTFEPAVLARGFMSAGSGLTIHGQNANDVVVAEAVGMVKEHIAETYGPIRYTIGQGCSGGGIQQYMLAATYPGLLDGLLPMCSFPDVWTTAMEVFDCGLLLRYFDANPHLWAALPQRSAVEGHYSESSCISWDQLFRPRVSASDPVNCDLDAALVYDASTRPRGVRCGLNDYQAAIYGPRPRNVWSAVEKGLGHGFPGRPFDNVGVQYGLGALNDGTITVEQFVDLNEKVGGYDIDGAPSSRRTTADPGASATAYRTGQVTNAGPLADVPIIDLRGNDNEEIHTSVYSYTLRQRLLRDTGTTANHALWLSNVPLVGDPLWSCGGLGVAGVATVPGFESCTVASSALLTMDEWLDGISRDHSSRSKAVKVLAHRPTRAVDSCWFAGRQVTDPSTCRIANPSFTTPRIVAGMPMTNDVLQCSLKPFDQHDYVATLTATQIDRLRKAFPKGVCDYRVPGVGQQRPNGTWHTFNGGPGGRPTRP